MVDWEKETGNGGSMRIRDTGDQVEFWIRAGNSVTWVDDMPWGYTVNGNTNNNRSADYHSGGDWKRLETFNVDNSQTVTFRLFATGTSGLGGPTYFSHSISRSSGDGGGGGGGGGGSTPTTTVPPKPNPWEIIKVEDVRVLGDTDGNSSGGLSIDRAQVGYGADPDNPLFYQDVDDNGWGWVGGNLTRDKTYYFWVRLHNSKGWSEWSNRRSAHTNDFPPAPTKPDITNVKQSSVRSDFSSNGTGGSDVLEWQTGYGTSSSNPQKYISDAHVTIDDLSPGETYYFWGRGRNKYGWGNWSGRASATLLAGAWVDVNGVKKRAVPFVNVNGTWKVAEAYAKIGGLWEGTG